ncbi:serine/threonine-protein kinase [Actinomadura viridis]|nr:serine/threonine-protein kinase [Actinomadura viridis]
MVGPYRLEGRLGGGGMGQVFLGRSRGRRPVAVKVVRPELAENAGFRRRFADEVEAARTVGGFYTAHVVDADPEADPPWLVTAFIPGPSLERAVDEHGPLPVEALGVLGAGLAEGLAAIHHEGLVHRDLKPGNIILTTDGPRVIDFGIARALDAVHLPTAVLGTPGYMAPEQAVGLEVGPPSDVFALGSVLTFAATGCGPFGTGPAGAIVHRSVHEDPDLTRLPSHLTDLIGACLAKDPRQRPTLTEILDRLALPPEATIQWPPLPLTAMINAATAAVPTALLHTATPVADKIFEQVDASGRVTTAVFRRRSSSEEEVFTDFQVDVDPDMVVVGGGAIGADTPTGALLTASYPNSSRTAWLASSKAHAWSNPHRLIGFAIGLKIAGLSRDQLLANLSFTQRTSESVNHPAESADVPAGFTLIGGGFRVNWQPGEGNLATASFPEFGDEWTARSKAHDYQCPCPIDAFSVGLRTHLPEVGRVERGSDSALSETAAHPCASTALTGGFALTGIGAEVRFNEPGSLLWRLEPTFGGDQQGVTASSKDHGSPAPAEIKAWAIGIRLV